MIRSQFLVTMIMLMVIASGAMADSDEPSFYIKVSMKATSMLGNSSGSGGFSVPAKTTGRVVTSFYADGSSWRTSTRGSASSPVMHLMDKDDRTIHTDSLWMTMDVYVKPQVTADGLISLTTTILHMNRVENSDEAHFTYSEEKHEFSVPNGGSRTFLYEPDSVWKSIELNVSVYTDDPLVYEEREGRYLNINAGYSLFNEEAAEFVAKDCHCTLGMSVIDLPGGSASCSFRNMFYLDSGDSLLLLTSFDISNTQWHIDNTLTFDFDVSRHYALNPYDADIVSSGGDKRIHGINAQDTRFQGGGGVFMSLGEHGLAADKLTIKQFHRKITVSVNDSKIEIEIPSDDDNMLPFPFVERIVLTNTIETKSY